MIVAVNKDVWIKVVWGVYQYLRDLVGCGNEVFQNRVREVGSGDARGRRLVALSFSWTTR